MKFKRVEIQAFKSYLGNQDGVFDFTVKESQPADIVSIYAPNGFGKTSFYDAIDFCMTNNITRFIRDPSLANINNNDAKELNQTGQKQHILRAKNAPENLESVIKITTDSTNFERKVSPARNGSKDYTFDDKKTKVEERYFRSVMLSQEAIDCFLRELKPEARYERFMSNQLGGDDTLEKNRQQIQLMLGGVDSRIDKLQRKVDEITSKNLLFELGGESSIDSKSLTEINELTAKLNEKGGGFTTFDDTFDEERNAKLLLQVAHFEEKTNQKLESIQTETSQFEQLLDNYPIYEKNHSEIEGLNRKISKLKKQKDDIELFQELNEKHLVLTEQLNTQRISVERLREHNKNFSTFAKQMHIQHEHNGSMVKLREKLDINDQAFKNNQAIYTELDNQKNTLQGKSEALEAQKKSAFKHFSEIVRIEENIHQKKTVKLVVKNIELEKNIADIKLEGLEVKGFVIDGVDSIIAGKFNNEALLTISKNYSVGIAEQKKTYNKLVEIEGRIDEVKQQKNSVSDLIKLGSQLINQTQNQHCPLCQHKHDSFKELADAINSNSSLSDTMQRHLKELEACQTKSTLEDEKLRDLKEDFSTQQKNRLDSLRQQLEKLLEEHKSIGNILEQAEKEAAEVTRLKGLTLQKTPELYKSYIDGEIATNGVNLAELKAQISKSEGESQRLGKEAQQLKIGFVEATSKSKNGNEFIANYLAFLAELNVSLELEFKERDVKEVIVNKLDEAIALFEDKQKEFNSNEERFNKLEAPYPVSFFENLDKQMEDISTNLTKLSKELVPLNEGTRDFYNIINELGENHLLKDGSWSGIKQAFEDKISVLLDGKKQNTKLISMLASLITLAKQVLKYIKFIKSTDEQKKFELQIEKYSGIKKALLIDLRGINDSLEAQINHYFHVDLINTIYKKIDPHPDFNKINFKCFFPDDGKPKLQVYITDNEGENIISPTLSFSSAQINVLSLSIFLAKALNTTDNGKKVDCIFIDDPVQSMDSINVLGVIDLLRSLSLKGKQIIVSTHDDNFHNLLKQKIPEYLFNSKFLELESFGKVAPHEGQ